MCEGFNESDQNLKVTVAVKGEIYRWLYLEPILTTDEGDLGAKFRKVDQGFRQVARMLEADPRLSALVQSTRLEPMLDSILEQLHSCQSSLNQYIDEKRSIFPRLYFLSDDDLLELLGQARAGAEGRAAVMQTHLKKLFPGISSVRLGPGDMSITALCCPQDEDLQLDHPVNIDCPVEVWLKSLEHEMRKTLRNLTLKCSAASTLQDQDPFTLPTQILCLVQNIRFTEQVEKAIAIKELHKLKENIEKENLNYCTNEIEDDSERLKRQAVILQCGHYLSVVQALIDNNVVTTTDWHWQKQLRFYLTTTNKEVEAKMGLATVSYSYEYLGINTGQFVRTELADECFFILTQSLHLGFMGNPFGPAGTGKTESVKALGGLLGRLVLVFNCDEAMDAECMGRLLSGLALSGAWGCFDEFNRLSAATLAAVTHQLSSLLPAMSPSGDEDDRIAIINGKQIKVSEWCGVAGTMNPVGGAYGGRRSLPAALERVVRPVSMSEPPGALLAERLLAARRAAHAHTLAADMHSVFEAASQLLSEQKHYDWGLRALKAAVGSCGDALQKAGNIDEVTGRQVARRVLRLNNLSKLTKDDAERFEKILSLVFSGVPEETDGINPLSNALKMAFKNLGLVCNETQIRKCMELHEQMQQRMGVAIVGPPGSGKTTIRQLLKNALSSQGKNVVEYVISPKAMSRSCLLGRIDHDTRQWTDGVISSTALEISNQPPDVLCWVVCDGEVDPEWVESLNSVLDDTRALSLAAGWSVQLPAHCGFLFEATSLQHASPATVSRLAIILLSEESNCVEEVLQNWSGKIDSENDMKKRAVPVIERAIRKCMTWFYGNTPNVLHKIYDVSMVKQILTQFEYVVENMHKDVIHTTPEELVYLAIERSISGKLKENAIPSFYEELSEVLGPSGSGLIAREKGEGWVADGIFLSPRLALGERSIRASLRTENSHILLLGPDSTAKSILIDYILKETNYNVVTIDITPMTEPDDVIAELKRNNVISAGGASGVSGAGCALVVRGLHRARRDHWGSCALHHQLLQIIQHGGVWAAGSEGARPEWWGGRRVRLLATAAARPDERLAAAMALTVLEQPDDDELLEIAKYNLKQSAGKTFNDKELSNIAITMLGLYKEVLDTFDTQPQYNWNPDHLKNWCEHVKWYTATNVNELMTAIHVEANEIFKNRLISKDDKQRFDSICKSHLKSNNSDNVCYIPKLKGEEVRMETLDYSQWCHNTQKLISQCLTDDEHAFGDFGVEVSRELEMYYSAISRACIGHEVSVCASSAGAGARAAAALVAADISASAYFVTHAQQFPVIFKNALTTAGEATRTLLVLCELAVTKTTLSTIEAVQTANSLHAIPTNVRPSQNSPHTFSNIKNTLGFVILLDKDEENIRDLIENYPLLHNSSHFVWLDRWSDETLRQMPPLVIQRLIKENLSDTSTEELQAIPTDGFVQIYDTLTINWTLAPCRYIQFIKSFFSIYTTKKKSLTERQNMLTAGVEALRHARSEVATLQAEAATQEAALQEKQQSANRALEQIAATVRTDTDRREEMHALRDTIQAENDKLQLRKKEIEAELASVEPVIAAARAAVGDIRTESLSEIRSLRAPPDVVRDVLEGVLRLMGIADTSWHSMKNFLSKRGVKEDIRCLDAADIKPEAVESVQRLLAARGASFEAAAARRASAACAPLAAWVRANLAHAAALARVQPLQAQQALLHRNLRSAEEQLAALSSGLSSVEQRVAALQQQLGRETRDAAALELRAQHLHRALHAAQALLQALASEYHVWIRDLEIISKEVLDLNTRSLLAAAYIVYLPDVTEPQARGHLEKWSELLGFEDKTFSVLNFLAGTEKQLKWHANGLPSDSSAIKNAVVIDQALQRVCSGLTPLIVDPDGEALSWLRNYLPNCEFISQSSDKLSTTLQYAARMGRTVVVTEVECTVFESHPRAPIVLVCARTPTVPAARAPTLAPVHFTARRDPLAEQLVYYALQQLKPEVDEKSKEIKLKKANLQKQQYELQENLLSVLSTNTDILHDDNLLASLKKTRETSNTISEALEAALAVESEVRESCDAYRPSADRAAILALAVKNLTKHRPLITLPNDVIQDVFVDALKNENVNNINTEQVIKYITRRIIERVLLSLHKKDKYQIVLHILKHVYDGHIPDKLWQLFLGNYILCEDKKIISDIKTQFAWIPDEVVKNIAQFKVTDEDFYNRLSLQNFELWEKFISSGDLNVISQLPLSLFEVLVAVSVLRPDSTYRAIVSLVDEILGADVCAAGGGARVRRGARWAARRPALLLAAHALDALAAHAQLLKLALHTVGVDEGSKSWEQAVEKCRGGGWVALVVGASPFTQELQTFICNFVQRPQVDFDESFRLWILSEDREIPPPVASTCIAVILEAPEGVKNNVISTLTALNGVDESAEVTRMRASLALFHAIVQERRAYIPQGWTQWYAWEWGDVSAGWRMVSGGVRGGVRGGAGAWCAVRAVYGARAARADLPALHALHRTAAEHRALPDYTHAHTMQDYISAFEALPNIDTPELLALPANCRIAWEKNAANDIINGLKELDSTVSVNQESKENVTPLKVILSLWKKLMSGCELIKADYQIEKVSVEISGWGGWWWCACAVEAGAAARLARRVHHALAQYARAPHSAPPLHNTPEEWQCWWAGPLTSAAYVRALATRARQALARMRTQAPTEVDLGTFLYPDRVIWALRMHTAEVLSCPVHSLTLTTKWEPRPEECREGAFVVLSGLAVAGAEWERGALRPASPRAPPHSPAPPLLVRYKPNTQVCEEGESCATMCLFSSSRRSRGVTAVRAPLRVISATLAHAHHIALHIHD